MPTTDKRAHRNGDNMKPAPTTNRPRHRAPWRITFDTNPDDCNLRCVMCEEHSVYSPRQRARIKNKIPRRRMSIATIERVVAECAPHGLREIIPSTMGEPLVYKHMSRIIALCHAHGIRLNLTTNGTFPRLGATRWAEQIVPVGADVKISWNGADRESQAAVMVGHRFQTGVENLRAFIRVRDRHAADGGNYCAVTLQMTFMEMNLAQVPKVVEFAIAEGVDRVKGHHLWAHFPEIAEQDLRRNHAAIARWNATVRECHAIAARDLSPDGRRIRLENFYEINHADGGELPTTATCPFLGREAWVNAAGRFDPCCAPDILRRTLGDFGNVADHGLLAIWNGARYADLAGDYMRHAVCQQCNMRKPPS